MRIHDDEENFREKDSVCQVCLGKNQWCGRASHGGCRRSRILSYFVRPDATRGSRPDVDRVGAASPHGECQAMRRRCLTWVWWALLLLAPNAGAQASPAVISRGTDAGGYSAFPDICRAKDGELLCAFHSGSGHVRTPSAKWPKCGRIMAIRSGDEGETWSKPVVIVDTPNDDRDPSLSCLKDGTPLRNWFALVPAAPSARGPWSGVRLLVLTRATSTLPALRPAAFAQKLSLYRWPRRTPTLPT
jgi:hypothetical protein